jgi:hypothetical protein
LKFKTFCTCSLTKNEEKTGKIKRNQIGEQNYKNMLLIIVCGSSFGPGGGGGGIPPGLSSGVFFVDEAPCGGCRSIPSQAREYVESLHQNQRDSLLYGKSSKKIMLMINQGYQTRGSPTGNVWPAYLIPSVIHTLHKTFILIITWLLILQSETKICYNDFFVDNQVTFVYLLM